MTDTLEDYEGTVSIGGRTITSPRFADNIDGLAGKEEELAKLVEDLDKASTASDMEISAEKTKLKTNNASCINTEIKVNEQKLETVISFKYLGSLIVDEGSKPEILSRIVIIPQVFFLKPQLRFYPQFQNTKPEKQTHVLEPIYIPRAQTNFNISPSYRNLISE